MENIFDRNVNREFFDDHKIHLELHLKMKKRIDHLSLEFAKIIADEYQGKWLLCHEIKLFGG